MSEKKRVLFCSEASFLSTGYATYAREVLNYLHSTGKYEVAEMASYGQKNDPRAKDIPWKYYGVSPNTDCEPRASEEEIKAYNSSSLNQFGKWAFERICLDFKPTHCLDIRDFWMCCQEDSPFRKCFNFIRMPTVDGFPQAREWIDSYSRADACFSYSDWGGKVLQDQSGGKINYLGSAPPSANKAYKPVKDKKEHKKTLGLDPNCKIIGTVMRNQRRKLFPDLFKAFKIYLDKTGDNNTYLYCHTSYPDLGWDIPELLLEHGVSSRVLFTYLCPETKKPFPSLFKGAVIQSPFSGKWGATMSSVKNGVSYEELSKIYNLFDVYTQYACAEGFGLPMVEAAACGVPVCGTDYSAMESVLRKLNGFPITPKALYKELETGCMRAVPDNEKAAKVFEDLLNQPLDKLGELTYNSFLKHYQWEDTGKKWETAIDNLKSKSWDMSPDIKKPKGKIDPKGLTPHQQARWLILNVLCDPSKLNTFFEAQLIKDLVYKTTTSMTGGIFFDEDAAIFDSQNKMYPFNFDIAYDKMLKMRSKINFWEKKRVGK